MPKKVREVLKIVQKEGWVIDRQRGSHRQMKHPDKPGRSFTIAGNLDDELKAGTEHAILKAAGLK